MKSGNGLRFAALATAGAIALSACSSAGAGGDEGTSGSAAKRGGTLTLGIVQDVKSFDPGQAHVGHQLQPYQLSYDSLLLREPDGTIAPMLATKWGYTDDTNTTFSLDLRTGVTFSDGAAFDADAAKANLEHFKTANGPQASQLAAVDEVTAVDKDTVELHLTQPDPALEYYLSQAAGLMGSPKALGSDGIARVPVGSGPYEMDSAGSVVGSQYVFTARDDYWNKDLQHWDKIVLKFLPDVTARVNALVSGQVDATLLDARTVDQATGAGKKLVESEVDWQGMLLFDRGGAIAPQLADVRVRQAINYAFDKKTILQQLQGGYGTVTSQVFGKNSTAYDKDLDNAYPFDPAKAKKLLSDAGYPNGFTLKIASSQPLAPIMPFITQPLADIGITVEPTDVPISSYQTELGSGKYPAAWFSLFQGPTWVASNQLLSTDALYNPFDTTDPKLTGLVEKVRAGGDDADDAAKEINRFVTENAWFAPWFRAGQLYVVDPKKVSVKPQVEQAVPSIYNYTPVS